MEAPADVVDYDPAWPTVFEEIRRRVTAAVTGARVEHVGSTAVPGLAAKPIIDVDVVVRQAEEFEAVAEQLAALGYIRQGDLGVAGREAFAPPADGPYHHLYVVVDGSAAYRNHVDLRDHLATHPEDARRYAARKREVAYLLRQDREAYVEAKSEIIQDILNRARAADRSEIP